MKANRSDKYQYAFREVGLDYTILSNYKNGQSISSHLNPYEYNEDLLNLEEELNTVFWSLANKVMTPNQKQIVDMYLEGLTQVEIAKALGINQSSVTKTLRGNIDYTKKRSKTYGGVIKKLKKAVAGDQAIQELLIKIEELREEKL